MMGNVSYTGPKLSFKERFALTLDKVDGRFGLDLRITGSYLWVINIRPFTPAWLAAKFRRGDCIEQVNLVGFTDGPEKLYDALVANDRVVVIVRRYAMSDFLATSPPRN